MAVKKTGLGRGINALFSDNSIEDTAHVPPVELPIIDIEPNKNQARREFDETALAELADSIAKHGVLQPLLVRPMLGGGYQLIAGERRWRASRMAGLTAVPVVIKNISDEDAAVISLIENLQREDLGPIEEACGYETLIEEFNLTQAAAAEAVGKSRAAVANTMRLLKLPQSVRELVQSGQLSAGHARALLALEGAGEIEAAAQAVLDRRLSVRQTEAYVKLLRKPKKEAPRKESRAAFYDEVELSLNQALGRKARVVTRRGKEDGVLELAFYDKDDLARIAQALSALEE